MAGSYRRPSHDAALQALFSGSPTMMAVASLDGRCEHVNPAWERVLGATGSHVPDLAVPEHRSEIASALAGLAEGETWTGVHAFAGGAGLLRWTAARAGDLLVLTAAPQPDAATELGAVASAASHDLRAPLRAIDGFTRIILRDEAEALSDDGRRFLDLVVDAVADLATQVDGIVTAARLGLEPLRREEVDVAALVGRLGARADGALPACNADRRLLEAALRALLPGPFAFDAAQRAYAAPWPGTVPFVVQRAAARHGGRAWSDGSVVRLRLEP